MSNARQLGGYVIGDKTVRKDVLLRSGALSEASDEALAALHDKYRLALVVDFRSSMERGAEPDRDVEEHRTSGCLCWRKWSAERRLPPH